MPNAGFRFYPIEILNLGFGSLRTEAETSIEPHRTTGFPTIALAATSILVVATVLYAFEGSLNSIPNPAEVASLYPLAYAYLLVLFASIIVVLLDAWRLTIGRAAMVIRNGFVPLSPSWMVPYVLSQRRYRRVFFLATGIYGIFFSFLTSLIVYQPWVDYSQNPGAPIPSAPVVQLFGAPFYVPEVTVFLTNHLALILIPLTMILLALVSVLVGLNLALTVFAFDNRAKTSGKHWLGGLGAAVGLFTGCPTCAGLVFASVLGGAGAVSSAVLLQYYQPVFIALSVPVLLATPFIVSRSLSRVFREGCVVIGAKEAAAALG